jgi:rhodanese-related sulfurtransferase/ABC-type phosphate/phosphonate transport system substrate-binding protein
MLPLSALADFRMLVGYDPADDTGRQNRALGNSPAPSLSAALGAKVSLRSTSNLTEVMRATRTQENDVLIGPPHVTASAVSHGYQLLAREARNTSFVLVARKGIARLEDLAGKRLYLTQQDSARAYLAKGLLTENEFDIKRFKEVIYGKTSGGGLLALATNLADVTIAEQEEAQQWVKANPDAGTILKSTRPVPAGAAIMVRKTLGEAERRSLLKWIGSPEASQTGFGKLQVATGGDQEQYRYIASLGILTPPSLPGAQVIGTKEVAGMIAAGAIAIDTRTEKEYLQEHIRGAIHVPYVERSLKDRDFDASQDDFTALGKVPKDKPLIFFCNGPECWKSYKASKMALEKGYGDVRWYRMGMPEWREQSMPTASGKAQLAAAK